MSINLLFDRDNTYPSVSQLEGAENWLVEEILLQNELIPAWPSSPP